MGNGVLLFVSALAFSLVGCHPKPADAPAQAPAPASPAAPSKSQAPTPSACEISKSKLNEKAANWSEKEKLVHVERHFQRVVRKDCTGKTISDKIETVRSPLADLVLRTPTKQAFKSVFVFNESSCDHLLTVMPVSNLPLFGLLYAITGNGKDRIQIRGDMTNALLTFHLNEGLNNIFVQFFYDCSPHNIEGNSHVIIGAGNCDTSKEFAIGKFPIRVTYEEKTLNGILEVRPTSEECQRAKEK